MTYDELADCVAEVLVKNGWETIDLEPLTLQFVPWDVNSNVHFYGDAVEYVVVFESFLSLKLQDYQLNFKNITITRTPTNTDTMRAN